MSKLAYKVDAVRVEREAQPVLLLLDVRAALRHHRADELEQLGIGRAERAVHRRIVRHIAERDTERRAGLMPRAGHPAPGGVHGLKPRIGAYNRIARSADQRPVSMYTKHVYKAGLATRRG